ncbi:MAG: hypothetical protein PHS37_05340 [Candidatus Omnitrophica bacterium]|nr:hypothetical protein [Candidatus Omnitrophota bacterium]
MKNIMTVMVLGAIMGFGSAAHAAPIAVNQNEVERAVKPVIQAVVESFNTNNYSKMAVYFGEVMFKEFPQFKFDAQRKTLFPLFGTIQSTDFLSSITQENNTVAVYKGHAEKTEFFLRIVLSKENDRTVIVGLWFT